MKKKILFSWEHGLGLGHIGVISPLIQKAMAAGFDVVLAAKESVEAAKFIPSNIRKIPVPVLPQDGMDSINHSELLLTLGFGNKDALLGAVNEWGKIFATEDASALVAEFAPVSILAARVFDVPTVVVGAPFNIPGPQNPQPPFRFWDEFSDHDFLREIEVAAVDSINHVLSAFNKPLISSVFEMYSSAVLALNSIEAVDHFERDLVQQPVHYTGGIQLESTSSSIAWPEGNGKRVFAYLRKSNPSYVPVMQALIASGHRVVAYVPDLEDVEFGSIKVTTTPISIEQMTREADTCVCYGSLSTTIAFVQNGIPVVFCPDTAERGMVSFRVASRELGFVLPPGSTQQAAAFALQQMTSEQARDKAKLFSGALPRISNDMATEKVMSLVRAHAGL